MSDVGAVIIANNTDEFDYIKLAEISANKIKTNLNIPVALITGKQVVSPCFDKVIIQTPKETNTRYIREQSRRITWLNMDRTRVYDLSPWDRTLVVDADFFVHTDTLSNHLKTNVDFSIARQMYDPVTGNDYVMKMGKTQIDQCWATVMIFNKCSLSKMMFDMAEYTFEHWEYYHKLYRFNYSPFRNDYAFTIASHLLGGYGSKHFDIADYKLCNCDFNTEIAEINDNNILVTYKKLVNNQVKSYIQRIKSDVHIQHKISLFERLP